MSDVPAAMRRAVVKRAANRCEYCRLSQEGQEAAFHIDHIVPRVLQGSSDLINLALACVSCSLRKSAKINAVDPQTGKTVPLFNPRVDRWNDHFRWEAFRVVPLSETGRATVSALSLNRPIMEAIRSEEAVRGRHPAVDSAEQLD